MSFSVKSSEFRCGVSDLQRMPPSNLPEIALIGRSNVGKSSLINRLTGRKNLARTSQKPGSTQQLNLFEVRLGCDGRDLTIGLVDLPGFGYAQVSKKRREALGGYTVDYIEGRENLRAVCLLNDCRRDPEEEELALREICFQAGHHLLVVVTKCDKLGSNERRKRLSEIAARYSLESGDLIISGEKMSADPLWQRILPLLG